MAREILDFQAEDLFNLSLDFCSYYKSLSNKMHKSVDMEILDYACLTNYVYENKLFITVFDILISDFNILKLSKSRRLCFFIVSLKRPYIHKLI